MMENLSSGIDALSDQITNVVKHDGSQPLNNNCHSNSSFTSS